MGNVFLEDLLKKIPQAPSKLSTGFLLDIVSAIPTAQK